MRYMLDTNVCIYIIKKRPPSVLKRFQSLSIDDVCISSITLAELEYGVAKSAFPEKNKLALIQFIAPLNVLSFDDMAAVAYGGMRAQLEKRGDIVGSLDMLIAAHAISRKLRLVTNNSREFDRIEALEWENWV